MISSSRRSPARTYSRKPVATAVAALALTLTAACGEDSRPGVAVTNAQSDVVFGNQTPSPTPRANAPQQQIGPQGPGVVLPSLPPIGPPPGFENPTGFPTDDSGPPASQRICPGPPVFATAPKAATISVEGQPKQGFYFWQSISSKDVGNNIKIKMPKYTNYQVRNVSPITSRPNAQGPPTETFTYDLIQPVGQGSIRTITYQVKQNAPRFNVKPANAAPSTTLAEPDAGVSIKKEVLTDSAGKVVSTFEPATPVLILPLPISGGASFTGAGTDPRSGSQLTVSGTIIGPSRVTTCVSFVQGYRVEATVQSTSGGATTTSDQAFTIETQTGGLVINTEVTPTGSDTTQFSTVGDPFASPAAKVIPKGQGL